MTTPTLYNFVRDPERFKTRFGRALRVLCVDPRIIENMVECSAGGLEERIIAKDLLYKFNAWLQENKGRAIELDPSRWEWCSRRRTSKVDCIDHPRLPPHIRSCFRDFLAVSAVNDARPGR
jgi:hypothetical protein